MEIFKDLGNSLNSILQEQMGLAENKPGSLDSARPGDYGRLGDFASKIDKTAHRSYVEDGVIRNIRPRALEIISQEPDMTIVIKKRLFSSLKDNYKADLLDEDELLFIRATKTLLENKCRAIAAYERLTKYDRIASQNDGIISDYMLPGISNAIDVLNNLPSGSLNSQVTNTLGKTKSVIDTIKRVKSFSDPNFFTTWIKDENLPYASPTGDGLGTFELTTISGITATNSVEFGQGRSTLTIEDPYKLMLVTNEDIEQAITDAQNRFKQNNFFRLTDYQLEQTINDLKFKLGQNRAQTGASQIRFVINEDTILYKKVTAYIEQTGRELKFSFDSGILGANLFAFDNSAVQLDPTATEGRDGLQGIEEDLFKQIIKNTYVLMGLRQTTRSEIKEYNKETNIVRKKMRLHYAKKPIIQPMDVVSIFISSKTIQDPMINQGMRTNFASGSLLNALDETIGNLESALDNLKSTFSGGSDGESYLENERNAIAGPDFPLWLWSMLRNDFTKQAAGTCVFNGIVKSSSHANGSGKYTLSVSVDDNCHYFEKSQINTTPSLDVYNSPIYDPLTPFKLNFDESSGLIRGEVPPLLDVNARLLNSGCIRAKLGRYKGRPIDAKIHSQPEIERIQSNINSLQNNAAREFRRKFVNPDGFVYRWKEGIGSLALWGDPYSDLAALGSFKSERSPLITRDPFAGQDTMNVLSLLITGQPYNYNTFLRGATAHGQLHNDDLFNDSASASFFRGLISDVSRANSIWGNFIPFKKLVVNDKEYKFLASGQFDLTQRNEKLNKLLKERAEAYDLVSSSFSAYKDCPMFYWAGAGGVIGVVDDFPKEEQELVQTLVTLDTQISTLVADFEKNKSQLIGQASNGTLNIFGNDISFDPYFTKEDGKTNETKRRIERAEFRKKINNLTLRRLWRVKANEDPNLFIVDDTYDKNYDIQSFEQALSGQMEAWKSNYANPYMQIDSVKKILGLEVFADSQGHIRARPPQYNRMPSSVFNTMLQEKAEKGIKIFPDYLESLFFNQVQGMSDHLEIVEDEIRLYAAALGKNTDSDVEKLIGGEFKFLTRRDTGTFANKDIRSLIYQNEPDIVEEIAGKSLDALSGELDNRINAIVSFDATRRTQVAFDTATFKDKIQKDVISTISNRIRQKTQQNSVPSSVQDIMSNDRKTGRSQVDILNVLNQIGQYVSERQQIMKSLKPAVTSLRDGLQINSSATDAGKSLLFPNLNSKKDKTFPELLESMIEDEDDHDLGAGAGSRYVISDDKIISFTLNENEPPYNFVQVDGRMGQGIVSLDSGLEVSPGGNAIATAWGVDYDMWQMYGFRAESPVVVPFFNNPHTQCAPFAVYLLNLARKRIFTATCTVIGSEFYQAGEVYYIESYDLLFYANSVTHNFTYNGAYTTTLDLTFGHNPGEYIPTQLDIIGKGLYTNGHRSDIVRQVRHNRGDNTQHLTVLIRDTAMSTIFYSESETDNVKNLVQGRFADQNRKNLSNMLLSLSGLLTPTTLNSLNIELRLYMNSNSDMGIVKSDELEAMAGSVKAWLLNPQKVNLENSEEMLPDTQDVMKVDPSKINVVIVDLDKEKTGYSPSSQAWTMARHLTDTANVALADSITALEQSKVWSAIEIEALEQSLDYVLNKKYVEMLSTAVIDVWVKFVTPESIVSETSKK